MLLCAALLAPGFAAAQDSIPVEPAGRKALIEQLDKGRIGIVTGGPGGTYLRLGADMQNLVESVRGDDLRVIVMVGRGSVGNLQDLSFLRYVDLALVQADVLRSIERSSPSDFTYLNSRIAYVASFHPEIIHVVARGGPFTGPADLAGKRVAIGGPGSGTTITAPIVLRQILGVDFTPVPMGETAALNDLLSDNPKIDAFVYVAGRGSSVYAGVSKEVASAIRDKKLAFIPFPSAPPSDSPYQTVEISDRDYPSFIPIGEKLQAWAVPAVLAAYNWDTRRGDEATDRFRADRYRRIEAFVTEFFNNRLKLNDGPGGFNENWCSVDIARPVSGWQRLRVAEEWLASHRGEQTEICAPAASAPAADALSCRPFRDDMAAVNMTLDDPAATNTMFRNWQSTHPGRC